jgi:mannitol/fructose-specific phosphotransferase system IIA component (Ntr-type)
MELKEIISENRTLYLDRAYGSKRELLSELLDHLLAQDGLLAHKAEILQTLVDREESMSTGIGQGIAIPHCSTAHEKDLSALLAVLKHPIDYQSVDEDPVRILILLLLPKDRFEKHIKTLAAIARQFNDPAFRQEIASAESAEAIYQLVQR